MTSHTNDSSAGPTNDGQLTSQSELRRIFDSSFPRQDEIVYAFGYGSGVFQQGDTPSSSSNNQEAEGKSVAEGKKMLDLILVVRDAKKFHQENLQVNPHHYAPLFQTTDRATWWQKHDFSNPWLRNPKVFFNFVEDPWMKYGIMEASDLCSDLRYWDSLYIGGRLHKPTATILHRTPESEQVDIVKWQQECNLPAAVSAALLLSTINNNETKRSNGSTSIMSLSELYSQISALSYTGDFRMQVGAEDPGKINKLVQSPGQLDRFHQLYRSSALQPLIKQGVLSLDNFSSSSQQESLSWNPTDLLAVQHLWQKLPPQLQRLQPPKSSTASNSTDSIHALQNALYSIIAPGARYQSFKGLFTAGLAKSARYALAKLSKGLCRKR
jgi:translocator assembly and maintenance protein 41